jgi:hypothetical protein
MKDKKREYIWMVDSGVEDCLGDYHFKITVRLMDYTDSKIRNLSGTSYNADPMSNLVIEQTNWIYKYEDKRELYHRESIHIDGGTMELKELENGYKTLKKIHQGLDKIADEEGQTADFADLIKRVAQVLKIKTFCWVLGTSRGWHNENNHEIAGLKDGLYHIRNSYRDEKWLKILEDNNLKAA